MPDLELQPALQGTDYFETSRCQIRHLPSGAKVRVQALPGHRGDSPIADPLKLPSTPGTACGTDPHALWRAPGDWLVYSLDLTAEQILRWVEMVESAAALVITDNSHGSVVIELSGEEAVEVLMRECTLDLEGDAIPVGGCALTLFAQTTVMIHRPSATSWRLFVERPVARHVWNWLLDSAEAPPMARV